MKTISTADVASKSRILSSCVPQGLTPSYTTGTFTYNGPTPKSGYSTDVSAKAIIDELPNLGLNLDKIIKLESEEDKKRIINMFTELCKMAIQYETRDYEFNSFHFKMIYNSLHNCDFLCTNRNKNLTNLLEDEK